MNLENKIKEIENLFNESKDILIALGDETRQHIILEMMKMNKCSGVRVGEITSVCNLSRPAVSHHLQILKNAHIINIREEGTKNYYYFDLNDSFSKLEKLIKSTNEITKEIKR